MSKSLSVYLDGTFFDKKLSKYFLEETQTKVNIVLTFMLIVLDYFGWTYQWD